VRPAERRAGGATRGWQPGPVAVAVAIVAGAAADAVFADPARFHPVAGYGRAAQAVERRLYADSRPAGVAFVAVTVGGPVLAAAALDRRVAASVRPVLLAAALWAALGGTSLRAEGMAMSRLLTAGDLEGGRDRLGHLCGRDPRGLDEPELARAAIESVAENTADAVLGPLLWGAVCGLPGVIGYRAVNTLDAMVGHRSARYLRFGWAAARLDDVANLAPARLCAALTALAAPVVGGSPRRAWRVWRRDGDAHPSPNAGQCEAAFAGALDVTLGGTNIYGGEVETRGRLGDGPPPRGVDVARSADLSAAVATGAVAIAALLGAGRAAYQRRRRGDT
jgi:adenosylcobinamide-phosphate synthase